MNTLIDKYLIEMKVELKATYESIDDYMSFWINQAKKEGKNVSNITRLWKALEDELRVISYGG